MRDRDAAPEWIPADEKDRLESTGSTSTGISLRLIERETLLQAIKADPNRRSFEKETNFNWSSGTDIFQVDTAEPSLMRRFVLHDHFRLRRVEVSTDRSSGSTRTMDAEELREVCSTTDSPPTIDPVFSVKGISHVGLLKVRDKPRTSTGHAEIVTSMVLENDPREDTDGGESP